MNVCKNIKCKKKIINFYLCKYCTNSYCSNNCLNSHNLDAHKERKTVKKMDRNYKSPFYKEGTILSDLIIDEFFNFDNFDYVKTMHEKKKILGEGGFATVYLVRHRETRKEYAMKVVRLIIY